MFQMVDKALQYKRTTNTQRTGRRQRKEGDNMNAKAAQTYKPFILQAYKNKGLGNADAERRADITLQIAGILSQRLQTEHGADPAAGADFQKHARGARGRAK